MLMRAPRSLCCDLPAAIAAAATLGLFLVTAAAGEPEAGAGPVVFRTAPVTRGNVVAGLQASGTLEPEAVVDVAAQVTGVITSFGADPHAKGKSIDYGSQVEVGTLLATLDDTLYAAAVEQERAACTRAEANVGVAKAKLGLAKAEYERAGAPSDMKIAARAQEVAQASVAVAEATVVQSRVALKQAELNLAQTRIRSPVKGVIIDRRVNVGQTVVANAQAASLFLIAKDLENLQVWASVNEADIGRIRAGQPVRFTVDAYPGLTFDGKVAQIRLNATMTQNVVTYTVVVTSGNAGGKLLPYLTADVRIEVARSTDVLRVPNAALRWRPEPQWIVADARTPTQPATAKPGDSEGRAVSASARQPARGRVWVRDGKLVRPLAVEIGLTDGLMTEVSGEEVQEGMQVVVGTIVKRAAMVVPPSKPTAGQLAAAWAARQLLEYIYTSSGTKQVMERTLARMGSNQILVLPGAPAGGGVGLGSGGVSTLTPEDAGAIARYCPAVSHAAPIVRARGQVVYGHRNWNTMSILGTTPSYLAVRDWEDLSEGAAFTDADVRSAGRVCLIGETLKRELFQDASPIGQEVRIQNVVFHVVGVLSPKGANIMGLDQDDTVLAPWTTVLYCVKRNAAAAGQDVPPMRCLDQILAKAASAEQIAQAADEITGLLRQRHRIRPEQADDFNIRDMTEITRVMTAPWSVLTAPWSTAAPSRK
jgi:HlyD family secretion protein